MLMDVRFITLIDHHRQADQEMNLYHAGGILYIDHQTRP